MIFFITEQPNPSSNAIVEDGIKVIYTNSYIEVDLQIDADYYFVCYLIPRDANSVFVVSCWEDAFDGIIENCDDEDYVEIICDTYPLLGGFIANGVNDKYSKGALIKLDDFDTGDSKWFLASFVGNIGFDSIDDLLCDRTIETISFIRDRSILLLNELNTKSPDTFKYIKKGFWEGALMGLLLGLSD